MNARCSLVLLAFFLAAAAGDAQGPQGAQPAAAAPKESPLFVTTKGDEWLDERLFPLGWSLNGKFAWISRKVSEASDDARWSYNVLDCASNRMLESNEFTMPANTGESIAKFWAKNQAAIA